MGAGAQFGPSDQITEKVTFFNQKEGYEVIAIDGKKVAGVRHDQLTGAVSIGEFGSTLLQIFNPRSHTAFTWKRMTSVRGHPVYVFGFQVPEEGGTLVTDETTNQKVVAPDGGLIFADAETRRFCASRVTSTFRAVSPSTELNAWWSTGRPISQGKTLTCHFTLK